MRISSLLLIVYSLCLQNHSPVLADDLRSENAQTYIVDVKPATVSTSNVQLWHRSFLPASALSTDDDDSRMVYSYRKAFSGFSARLTESELESMKAKDGFVHAYSDTTYTVQTTYTPAFLGLDRKSGNFWNTSGFGNGVIIGMIDTGIFPSHPSFSGRGMPPPPPKWKGTCEPDASQCNNKLVGARVFLKGALGNKTRPNVSPFDADGHGTHTASTAAGRSVDDVDVLGNALGTAAGLAPMSHLATYRVCLNGSICMVSDILAGIDTAIADGVDVISVSLAFTQTPPFYDDPVAIGAFAAVEHGIFVSCGAGNSGPDDSSVSNDAPWITTVGASTTDRSIETAVRLGNGEEFRGKSLTQSNESAFTALPLIYPGAIDPNSAFCGTGAFDNINVRGKIVVCDASDNVGRKTMETSVKNAGGNAMILGLTEEAGLLIEAHTHLLPASELTFSDASKIKAYINQTSTNTTAMIIPKGTVFGDDPAAPMVAHFSSRGPSLNSRGIMKPDIVAPGVDILAAWPIPIGPSPVGSLYKIISGTSMATPHISGIAALLKSAHPDWSPAMIRSAIMTTADTTNKAGEPIADATSNPADVFAMGAGQVNPTKANNPGLVYDIAHEDYVRYMCGISLTDKQVSIVANREVKCSSVRPIFDADLNYPSFSVTLGPKNNFTRTVTRAVTNVGERNASYSVKIVPPLGVAVTVTPSKLDFEAEGGKSVATYSVEFARDVKNANGVYSQGSLSWLSSDKRISVTSPIVIELQ